MGDCARLSFFSRTVPALVSDAYRSSSARSTSSSRTRGTSPPDSATRETGCLAREKVEGLERSVVGEITHVYAADRTAL